MNMLYQARYVGLGLCFFICQQIFAQEGWQSKVIRLNNDGSLHYTADEKGNTIPDFSKVGYYQGTRSIPDV